MAYNVDFSSRLTPWDKSSKAQSICVMQVSNHTFIDIKVVDMNAASKDVSNTRLARFSES